jgi:hypothetical protein
MYEQHWQDRMTYFLLSLTFFFELGTSNNFCIWTVKKEEEKWGMTDVMQQSKKVILVILARGKTSKFKIS